MTTATEMPAAGRLGTALRESRVAILAEILIVLAPLNVTLALSARGALNTHLGTELAILGTPVVYLGMIATLLLLWTAARLRTAGWRDVGIRRPANRLLTIVQSLGVAAVVIGVVVILINPIVRAAGFPPRDMSRFDVLEGHLPTLLVNLPLMWCTAGFVEEIVWRGYLMNRLVDLVGRESRAVRVIVVVVAAAVFGAAHAYQGLAGVIRTGMIGAVFGFAYLAVGRNLWPLILAHAAIDTFDFVSHYLGR